MNHETQLNKVLLLVPDGVGIKNYLYSEIFKKETVSIILLHSFDKETLSEIQKVMPFNDAIYLPVYKENIREKFLRELIHLSRLKLNSKRENNDTIMKFWKRGHRSLKLKAFYLGVTLASSFVKSYNGILLLEKKYNKALPKNPFFSKITSILKETKPNVLFCTHQRALTAPTVFLAAKALNIPSSTVIYSWDNLPKARLALKADKYLVWSAYMKQELHKFYPEIDEEKVIVTGTPQFEFYTNRDNIIDRNKFFSDYGLDSQKHIICFSGDDIRTSPYDPEYLNDIAEEMTTRGMTTEYQIVFRRCPVDISGRYEWVVRKYPDLIVEVPPLWNFNTKKWTAVYPRYEDIKLLVSLAYYADLVINVGSTMAFDFGMFNKPCIYINYDHVSDVNWSVDTIYKYQHFRSMPSKNSVYWFNSKTEITDVILKAIENPITDINNWFNTVVNHHENASANIMKELT